MAGTLRLHLPRADLMLSVLAAVSVFAIVGVAVMVLRIQCLGGACFAVDHAVATGSIGAQAAAPTVSAFAAEPSAREAPTPFAEGLITATFARLAEMPAHAMNIGARAVVAEIPAGPVTTRRTAFAVAPSMVARMPASGGVQTKRWWWPGEADPVFPAPAPREEPAVDDNAVATVDDTPPVEESAKASSTAEAPTKDSARRIVAGQGVNVRSGPGKSTGVLFALNGGTEVSLTGGSKRGWLELRDARGRTGWAYTDYLLIP